MDPEKDAPEAAVEVDEIRPVLNKNTNETSEIGAGRAGVRARARERAGEFTGKRPGIVNSSNRERAIRLNVENRLCRGQRGL